MYESLFHPGWSVSCGIKVMLVVSILLLLLQTHRLLRGKALECVSLVGMAVGRDRFRQDAARVLAWLQVGPVCSHTTYHSHT
jgi:hypothetical protein